MDSIEFYECDNGWWAIHREPLGGLSGLHIKVDTFESAQKILIAILEHEYMVMER